MLNWWCITWPVSFKRLRAAQQVILLALQPELPSKHCYSLLTECITFKHGTRSESPFCFAWFVARTCRDSHFFCCVSYLKIQAVKLSFYKNKRCLKPQSYCKVIKWNSTVERCFFCAFSACPSTVLVYNKKNWSAVLPTSEFFYLPVIIIQLFSRELHTQWFWYHNRCWNLGVGF